jgi:serine/threonine-protein kinase
LSVRHLAHAHGQAGSGEPTAGDLADLPAGTEVGGRFRIRREIGRGGMGIVYEATQIALDREVALKTLHPELLRDPLALERFQREARAAAAIEHNGIVRVFDLATVDGVAFIVMERLRGEDLRNRIKREKSLAWHDVIKVGAQLADAIAAAHERGILHRDLSPANVFLSRDAAGRESVKVLDFGIARLLSAAALRSQPTLGTLMYMAPERVKGADAADPRSDVYAIGAVLYEAIAGVPPFPVCEYPELALKIALQEPLSLRARNPECPAALLAVVQRAMHREPSRRFQSARELCTAIEAIAPVPKPRATPDPLSTVPTGAPVVPATRGGSRWLGLALSVCVPVAMVVFLLPGVRSAAREPQARTVQHEAAAPTPAPAPEPEPALAPAPAPDPPLAATSDVQFVTVPPGAHVSVANVGACRAPCKLALPMRAGIVVRAQAGEQSVWQRLSLPLPAQVQLTLRPARPSSSAPLTPAPALRGGAPLPPLMPRR